MEGFPHKAPQLGLSRVCWVRIVLGDDGAECQVAGIAHRRPVVRSVSLATARSLVASGVPSVIRHATSVAKPSPRPVRQAMPAGADRG
ncbi:MAG TPA: hypothetical protein VHE80_11635 [Acidimicrobiales bacterium]|nr:hypothetical protein [Acidimicrobiales bacterium]